jgi:hypothetical protein
VIAVKRRFWQLSHQHCIPDRGRSLAFEPQLTQGELILVDTTEQFDASDRDGGRCEVLEAEHGPGSALDAPVILFNQVVQILRGRLLRSQAGAA